MTEEQIEKKVVDTMVNNKLLAQDESITRDALLREDYGFDSINIVQLIVLLETEFEIEFDDAELTMDHFSSIGTVIRLVQQHLLRESFNV
ncbi:acyl carrier protein [Paenibacillus sp. FSL R7-0331]|uniref:acyl carrier protein n=1 Tax=Paenibacillus sp. FSL R7-0331 TaxID=1536773 RepID=UPI0004F68D59|nr:acyl carrier protein [Paenibacillus sp. FSL R7-0331]AIQ50986.1 hypothetical protein R70331_05240 [Paenibacillus sp. FSL R7-0331]